MISFMQPAGGGPVWMVTVSLPLSNAVHVSIAVLQV